VPDRRKYCCTLLFNAGSLDAVVLTWRDPRYLAHSVRELLTFPVTYFLVPLYFILRWEKAAGDFEETATNKTFRRLIIFLAVVFLVGVLYQSYVPLTKGIASLSQRPSFAKNGTLGIPYLLASHYFEHFLDTVYFTLVCLLLYSVRTNKPAFAGKKRP
jgi:hypothetical protein